MEFYFSDTVIEVNRPTQAALMQDIAIRLGRREGFTLATVNLDHLVKLSQSAAFRQAYKSHDFIVADGHPIVWLSWLARMPVSLVPGSDLVIPLARLARNLNVPIALFGSTAETLELAATRLRADAPGLEVAICLSPGFGFDVDGEEADRMLDQLEASGAGLCFIALGAPRQEMFAARARGRLPDMGFASIGAGLDFMAGRQERAPVWMQRLALEWLWRMMSDPTRLVPRYMSCLRILPQQAVAILRKRSRRG